MKDYSSIEYVLPYSIGNANYFLPIVILVVDIALEQD